MSMRKPRDLERIFKGVANHRRIEIVLLLAKKPELSVDEIATELDVELKNASQHLQKLSIAGLVMKRHEGNTVRHALTHRGKSILEFARILV